MQNQPDICRPCAEESGTPWPAGATAPYIGPCTWCGSGDRELMPFADLLTDFEEISHYA